MALALVSSVSLVPLGVSPPQLSVSLSPRNLLLLHQTSVSRGFPALTSHSLSAGHAGLPLLLFDLVSHSAVSLSGVYTLVLPGFPPRPRIFSQSFPTLPCAHPGLIWNTRFRFPVAYCPSQLRCLLGFQTQHATNRTHHLSPQTCSFPLALL